MYWKLDIWPCLGNFFLVKLPNQDITMKLGTSKGKHFSAFPWFALNVLSINLKENDSVLIVYVPDSRKVYKLREIVHVFCWLGIPIVIHWLKQISSELSWYQLDKGRSAVFVSSMGFPLLTYQG